MAYQEYRLVTMEDLFTKIPVDRVDVCLQELAGMIKYHKQIDRCLSQLAKAEVKTMLAEGVTWIDDDRRDIKLNFK